MTTKFYEADGDLVLNHYCPRTDYLDVYNSSCRSSTQPYTVSDWSEDDISAQLSSMASANFQSSTACSETGSFECIDVAMENQGGVYRGGEKTVPKRQIQLKRRNTSESQDNDKEEVTDEAQCTPDKASHRRDVLMRQHSTPAAFHLESPGMEAENRSARTEQKQRLQKSMSLDESTTKTKMASCIITSVLTKKMQCEQNLQHSEVIEGTFASVDVLNDAKNSYQCPLAAKEVNTADMSTVDSHKQGPPIQYHQIASAKTIQNPLYQHNTISLASSIGSSEFLSPTCNKSEIVTALESEETERQNPRDGAPPHANESPGDRLSCDSEKGQTSSVCPGSSSRPGEKQARVKNAPEECRKGQWPHKQQMPLSIATQRSDAPGAGLARQRTLSREGVPVKEIDTGYRGEVKLLGQSGNTGTQGTFKAMAPVHVVRDVRRLVKNTYNLSFKNAGDSVLGQEDGSTAFCQNPIGRRGSGPHINQSDTACSSKTATSQQTGSSLETRRQCERTDSANEKQESPRASATNSFPAVPTHCPSAAHFYQPEWYQCAGAKDIGQNQGLPPRSWAQTTVACTPSPGCVQLNPAGGAQSFISPLFYTANPMSYQNVQTHVGMSFVQGPVLMQPQPQTRAAPTSPDTQQQQQQQQQQQYLCNTQGFMIPFSPEYRQGSTGLGFPEMAGGHGSRHVLLDPETGRCFYVDSPQQPLHPQRKMLIDPETSQFVEVLLPQQAVCSTVMPQACAMPFPSLPFPGIYAPQVFCIQAPTQEMPYSGP